jgi:spore coat protein U-like protein
MRLFALIKNFIFIDTLMAIGILVVSGVSLGATGSINISFSAPVVPTCEITNVNDIAFGAYDPLSETNLDAAGRMSFKCGKGIAYKTYIVGTRQMVGAVEAENLNFELYSDDLRTTVFPSDNSGDSTVSFNNGLITAMIYGRIPADQDVSVDTYSRILTATVEY